MTQTTIHCSRGLNQRQAMLNVAQTHQLSTTISYKSDTYSFKILTDSSQHDVLQQYLSIYKNDSDVTIFDDSTAVTFGTHMKFNPTPKIETTTIANLSEIKVNLKDADKLSHKLTKIEKKKEKLTKLIKKKPSDLELAELKKKMTKLDAKHQAYHAQFKAKSVPKATFGPNGRTAGALAKYYNFPTQNGTAPTIAIISLGGTYLTNDLNYYWRTIEGLTTLPTVTYVNVDGTTNRPNQTIVSGDGSDENTLDIEIAGATCPGAKIVVYFGQNTFQGFYNAINAAINDNTNKPSIISISWGASELYYTTSQLNAYNSLFQTANTKGISITVASGDNACDDGVGDNKPHCDFPSTSPYVIACGGTNIGTTETTWSWNKTYKWGTGGGISATFAEPNFQKNIITYPTASIVQTLKGKRAIPDIAMNADPSSGWTIYFNGHLYVNSFGGTSCVAPAMAGLLGLMNLSYPTNFCTSLYAIYPTNKSCFRDITVGTNDSIKATGVYNAGTGYDFCTGLGSLDGTQLFNTFKNITHLTTHAH